MPHLQLVNGLYRVRIVAPPALSAYLPPPYTGKANLVKGLGTGNKAEANRLAVPWIAEFQRVIDEAQAAFERARNRRVVRWVIRNPVLSRQIETIYSDDPDIPEELAVAGPEPVIFESMIKRWAKHTNAPKKGIQDTTTKANRFAAYLEHDDMAKVTFESCRDYRDAMIDGGELSPQSISNHLKALKALFGYACDNEPDRIPSNPMARVKFSPGIGEERDDFTLEERRTILRMAREAGLVIKWLTWLSSFTGARLSEIVDAHTRDIVLIDGVWVIKIRRKYRSPDQRLKTKVSIRTVPLHSALLAEGFLIYVESVGDGPLFPKVRLDGYGRRAGQASTDLSDWLRHVVKITDPNKPFYSLRHTATSYLRNTLLPNGSPAVKEDVERYLLGHAGKDVHAGYGKQWIETLKAAIEIIPNPLAGWG
jgi:integrase